MEKTIAKYTVGTAEVTIVKTFQGYKYIVSNLISPELNEEIRTSTELAIIGGNVGKATLYEIVRAAAKILLGMGKRLPETTIAYSLREALKYRKLQVLIDDPNVEDISVVGPGTVWVRHSLVLREDPDADYIPTNISLTDEYEFLQHINLLAEKSGRLITMSNPIVDANLPEEDGGHRIHLVLPEIAGGKGEIVIRKKRSYNIVSLKDLKKKGMINDAIINLINKVIRSRGSIMIVGPPGSGKTTLLRAILYDLVPRHWKVAIIEDTPEIDPPPDSSWVRYIVPLTPWGKRLSIDQMTLAKAALRSSVNRFIVVGETRGEEARVLVQAMNMGLGGLTTFHGGNAREALMRLMSPPINLTPQQVAMFDIIVTVGFVENGGLKRAVLAIDKPEFSREVNDVVLNRIYSLITSKGFDTKTFAKPVRKPVSDLQTMQTRRVG